jgi:hypothetical protein
VVNMVLICIRVSLDDILSISLLNRVTSLIGFTMLNGFDTVFIYVYYYFIAYLKITLRDLTDKYTPMTRLSVMFKR